MHVLLASIKPQFHPPDCQMPNTTPHTKEHVSTAPESSCDASYTTKPMFSIAHGEVKVVSSCLATETHFMKLPMHSLCAGITFRGSDATDDRRSLRVSALVGPNLSVWVVNHFMAELFLAPRCFYFTIIALIVNPSRNFTAMPLTCDKGGIL